MQRPSTKPSMASSPNSSGSNKKAAKRVLVVGAGAAGMSCADGLAKHPDRFNVTLIGMFSFQMVGCDRVGVDLHRCSRVLWRSGIFDPD